MTIKIEKLKKSDRGIEVTACVPYADCDKTYMPDEPKNLTKEQRDGQLIQYNAMLKVAHEAYIAAKRKFERLHLGDAELVQVKVETGHDE